ncbi:MAG TPA: metallophosphoesterase, partial [Yinghuangia sp.]|nr:metallophosphoesterase [Yinghuangia sp.]
MRVHVVSDVHGEAAALARAGDGADALVCLGDLILFIDYHDLTQGIFPELFGRDNAVELVALRTAKRFDEARAFSRALWASLETDPQQAIETAVRKQYTDLFAAFP